jgi:hypothetical protein
MFIKIKTLCLRSSILSLIRIKKKRKAKIRLPNFLKFINSQKPVLFQKDLRKLRPLHCFQSSWRN